MEKFHLQHFVDIYYNGAFFADKVTRHISTREGFELPENAFSFSFYDRRCIELDNDTLLGNEINRTKAFYRGVVLTANDVKRMYPENKILLDNIRINDWEYVVQCGEKIFPFNYETMDTI
jgi:hypothetical protein